MTRQLAVIALLSVTVGTLGCASAWETLSSRRFREKPYDTLFGKEDPLTVLRTNPDGEARARAMRRLEEPAAQGRPSAEQDEVLEILAQAATEDSSPWVRMSAIDTLGRFEDPRAVEILVRSYHQATGRAATPPAPVATPVAGREPSVLADRLGLHGPQGFPADQVASIRGRVLEAVARTGRPEAVQFLAQVARGQDLPADEDPAARDFVRQRAVAGLGKIRSRESVAALAQVLTTEHGKDITLTNLAHGGLVSLTGKKEPPDPQVWDQVLQAGFEIAPEPGGIERVGGLLDR